MPKIQLAALETAADWAPLCSLISEALLASLFAATEAVAAGNIQSDARRHLRELHRLSARNPRMLEELLIELSARHYRMVSFGLDLLALDRTIHELDTAIKAAVEQNT